MFGLFSPKRPSARFEPIVSTHQPDLVLAVELLHGRKPLPMSPAAWIRWHNHIPQLVNVLRRHSRLGHYPVTVNVDAVHLLDRRVRDSVRRLLASGGPWIVEWTEVTQAAETREVMEHAAMELRELRKTFGVPLAIDDFGGGLDGTQRMLLAQPDFIKIDGELFQAARDSDAAQMMTRDIVTLAHHQGCQVIIEWVSSDADLALARQLGADYAQGHLWSVGGACTCHHFAAAGSCRHVRQTNPSALARSLAATGASHD